MEINVSIEIKRPTEVVWPVLMDVERWPEWTRSMTAVERLDHSAFGIGSRVRILQPRLKAMVWQVSEFEPGRSFGWEARSPGVFVAARHEVKASELGSRVTLSLTQHGRLSPLIKLLFGNLTRDYMHMEAQGLKRRCESVEVETQIPLVSLVG